MTIFEEEFSDGTTTIRGTVYEVDGDTIAVIALEPTEGPLTQMTVRLTTPTCERLANICDQMRYALLDGDEGRRVA